MSYPKVAVIEKDPDKVRILLKLAVRNFNLIASGNKPDYYRMKELGCETLFDFAKELDVIAEGVEEMDNLL